MSFSFLGTDPSLDLLLFFGVWFLLWLPAAIPLAIAIRWFPPQPPTPAQKIPLVLSLYAIAPPLLWGFARLTGVPLVAYGLAWDVELLSSFALGSAIALFGVILLFALQRSCGWCSLAIAGLGGRQWLAVWLPALGIAAIVGGVEEWVFRGFLLERLQQNLSFVAAAAISSLLFAFSHLIWEPRATLPQLPGLGLMGTALALAVWRDGGSIGLAWGLHAGWVWVLASIASSQTIRYHDRAPAWGVGIARQPLASVSGLGLLLATIALLWLAP